MNRKDIKEDLIKSFEDISKKHNVRIFYNISYSNGDINVNLNLISKENYKKIEDEQIKKSEILGYPQNIIGLYFIYENLKYKIIDINMKKKAYPILCLGPTGKHVAFSNTKVREILNDQYINRENNLRTLLEDDDE